MLENRKNKKAQLGETLTWIVATLVILGVLLIFIYASLVLAKAKSLNSIKVKEHVGTLLGEDADWIKAKSEMALIRNPENQEKILEWINDQRIQADEEEISEES